MRKFSASIILTALSAFFVTSFATPPTTNVQFVYEDDFSSNPGGLNGRTTANGFGNWVTSDSALQTGDGRLTVGSKSTDDYHSATFALPTLSGSNILKISITTRPAGTGFLGIGFTDLPGQFVINGGLSWLYINGVGTGAPGNVEIFRGMGSTDKVYYGTPTGFDASLPTTYTFAFNPTAKTMGLSATNGTNSIVFFSALDIGNTSAAIRNFALQFQSQNLSADSTASYVSNIRAEVVPAPGTYAGWLTN